MSKPKNTHGGKRANTGGARKGAGRPAGTGLDPAERRSHMIGVYVNTREFERLKELQKDGEGYAAAMRRLAGISD